MTLFLTWEQKKISAFLQDAALIISFSRALPQVANTILIFWN